MHRAVFMDRDGTVSEEIGYMYDAGLYKPFSYAGPRFGVSTKVE